MDVNKEDVLSLSLFQELGQKLLINALDSVNGAKTLVLDPTVAGPLGLLAEVSLMKDHGVDKMFWIEPGALPSSTTDIIFLVRPKPTIIKMIAEQIKHHAREGQRHSYTLFLVPRISTLASRILEEEGLLGEINISSFEMQFIPTSNDVLSLEHDDAFKEIWMDGDETLVYDSAQALATFQKLYGLFPRIVGKGDYSKRLTDLLLQQLEYARRDSACENLNKLSDKVDCLIVLDRRTDMITPMLTQLTYEGLIDELIGIKNSHIEVSASLLTPQNTQGATTNPSNTALPAASNSTKEPKKKYRLDGSADSLFEELRDLNFSLVGKTLNKHARRLEEDYKAGLQGKSVTQLRNFVGKLSGLQTDHQSLRVHTGLTEIIAPVTRTELFDKALEIQQNLLASYETSAQLSAIEDLIAQGESAQMILRLLCLASIINGGIKAKLLENLKKEILQSYGYDYLPLILALSSPPLGILLPNPLPQPASITPFQKFPYASLRKSLCLVTEEKGDAEEAEDISYVYSGYAPLSIRLVQCVVQKDEILHMRNVSGGQEASKRGKGATLTLGRTRAHPIIGWKGFEDVLECLPGETFDITQNSSVLRDTDSKITATSGQSAEKIATTVVFFLGGCTYTEIAALRWMSRQSKGRNLLIATTGIINGSTLMNSLAGGK